MPVHSLRVLCSDFLREGEGVMAEKEQVTPEEITPEEVDQALRDADAILQYARSTKWNVTVRRMENIIRVIVKLAGR